ncbi:MAG TPA: HAMP domain-containing protein [Polyangiaceae bacterium]|nr:HAMP domain-containing protein [Polyangiaceae bacterium]
MMGMQSGQIEPPRTRPSTPAPPLRRVDEEPRLISVPIPAPPATVDVLVPSRRIRTKLVVLIAAMISLLVVGLAAYFPSRQLKQQHNEVIERAGVYAGLSSHQLRSAVAFEDQETAREVLESIARDASVDGIAVYTSQGRELYRAGQLSALAHAARRGFGGPRVFSLPGRVLATAPVRSLEGPRGTVVIELSLRGVTQARDRLVWLALTAGLVALAVGTTLAWLIAGSLARRIERIAEAATRVAGGDLSQHVRDDGSQDELSLLGQSFNTMVSRLNSLITQIRESAREESHRLDRLVRERTAALDRKNRDLRLVLDSVDQGFVTIDQNAHVVGEYSNAVERWFGPMAPDTMLWSYMSGRDTAQRESFEMGWQQLVEGILPLELTIHQMPRSIEVDSRTLELEYKPLLADAQEAARLLVVMTDVTARRAQESREQEERDTMAVTSRLLSDRQGFVEFFKENSALSQRIFANQTDEVALKRDLHTFKGNTALYGMTGIARICHDLESCLESVSPAELDCAPLERAWTHIHTKVEQMLGSRVEGRVEVAEREYLGVLSAVQRRVDYSTVEKMLAVWRLEPISERLNRVAEHLAASVVRAGKGTASVRVDAPQLYLDRDELAEFWGVFSHVIRNAAVHGTEAEADRRELGKSKAAEFALSAGLERGSFFIELRDFGPGIDWERVRKRAAEQGFPHTTAEDLERALFTDGLSTADATTEAAGRGVGLSAVRDVCQRKRCKISIASSRGRGASFRFDFDAASLTSLTQLEPRHYD